MMLQCVDTATHYVVLFDETLNSSTQSKKMDVWVIMMYQPQYLGSCGLHVLNNAFKHGVTASGWSVDPFLVSLYSLFKDFPARLEDFVTTNTEKVGEKFCRHTWLNDVPAAERALGVWDSLKLYAVKVSKKKMAKSICSSYLTVCSALEDVLMPIKLNSILCVVKVLLPLLTLYQLDKPLVPLIANDLISLVQNILSAFNAIKEDKKNCNQTAVKLAGFESRSNVNDIYKFSLGFVAD
ncbi:hypothetical protein PR048_004819 [Dryococelus australis]|uniref:Ubiquitin-like protease family profile domain-containing protein n=1 Tax=Dryococelus australis TaxID=614101 RepID=A0ABQ9I7K4_9NEOP|nr:hypothetical protein PR048_004819 [Dryococelus australis]